ncbi:methyl-accepting chemotaxis protein [Robertmurraya sp. Marseille-Q9965]
MKTNNQTKNSNLKYFITTLITVLIGVALISFLTVTVVGIKGKDAVTAYILIMSLGMVVGIISSTLNYSKYLKPIQTINEHIEKLNQKDLTYQTDEKKAGSLSSIATSLNNLSTSWLAVIEETKIYSEYLSESSVHAEGAVAETSKGSEQIFEVVKHVNQSMTTQMQNSLESSSAIEEMASGISRVADATSSIAENSQLTLTESNEGRKVIQRLKSQMESISSSMYELNQAIKELQNDSTSIGQIVKTIKEIAEQTNLLSLNASIEAARAGEHGRGFAVVANEVGKLAQETSSSAEKITTLVSKIQTQTNQTVSSMETSQKEVAEGTRIVDATSDSFDKITNLIDKITSEIEEISAISEEIAAGSEEVSASIHEVSSNSSVLADETNEIFTLMNKQKETLEILEKVGADNTLAIQQIDQQVDKFKVSQ